ncbi:MAG: SRPBCC domain-containing protein [Chloroflexota bacterium]
MKSKKGFTLTAIISAKPSEVYEAWLSTEGHSAMTGSPAQIDGKVGGKFSAWDGYIFGSMLDLSPNERILQAWRTTEFPEDAPDSRVEIILEKAAGGTKITLAHSNMPPDQMKDYRQGWEDFYFNPMREYFGK